jgi:predicted ATPase/class 3 adenylate cyclase/Tfp pilus assembly protein PilF
LSETNPKNYAILFTDIEGSTKLAQQYPDTMPAAVDKHHKILSEIFLRHNGFVFEFIGDAFCVAFDTIEDAIMSAIESQRALAAATWDDAVIKVRIGIHYGQAQRVGDKFTGYMTMARTQRIMSAAYGEQILISRTAYESAPQGEFSVRDLGERRLKDLIQPLHICQVMAEGLQTEFPPLKTLDARPNNLPFQLTNFIGREKEMREVKELLAGTHLLTLLGSGGSGKTRLALQVGADAIDHYNNGVWFVELEQLSDPILLPQTINQALKVQEESQKSPEDTLCAYVKDKEMLIILDNCEHIADACAHIAEKLLRSAPKLKMIVTSREALKCDGEQTHRLPSLETPQKRKKYTSEQLAEFESVKLFVERAQAVNPSFGITDENAPVIAGICSDLDGIPLAIELAAARIKVLSVEKIYERLSDRFKLLTGGKRTALPRQQTLKALIDWSYELLADNEKRMWEKLSVFSGGWTMEAAEKICHDDEISEYDILDILINLTEKSIIIYDGEKDRYRMLESIRQYGDDLLKNSGNKEAMSAMHLKHFMELAITSEVKLAGDEVKKWLEILETENGNMEAAMHWSVSGGDQNEGGKLAASFANYWLNRSYLTTASYWLDLILAGSPEMDRAIRGNILGIAGLFANMLGDSEKAEKLIEEGLVISRELGNKDDVASGLNNLASVVYERGDYTKARELIEETLAIDRESGDPSKISFSLINLGTVARLQGDYETAGKLLEESLAIRRKAKNKFAISSSLNTLGILHSNLGEYEKAKAYVQEGLKIAEELGNNYGIADAYGLMGNIEASIGNFEEAKKLQKDSLQIFEEMGKKNKTADCYSNLGNIAHQCGDNVQALELLEKGLDLQRSIGDKFGIALTLLRIGNVKISEGDTLNAVPFIEESLALRSKLGHKGGISECLNALANIDLIENRLEEAKQNFIKGLELHIELKNNIGISSDLIGLSGILTSKNKHVEAAGLLATANEFANKSGAVLEFDDQKNFRELENNIRNVIGETEYNRLMEAKTDIDGSGLMEYVQKIF